VIQGGLQHPETIMAHDSANLFDAASNAAAVYRRAIAPPCQVFARHM
jgi:hypothetical protein